MHIILASASPRRKELFGFFHLDFEVQVPVVDEIAEKGEAPGAFCRRIGRQKAMEIAGQRPGCLVIAADTVVSVDDKIFGKPADKAQAAIFLRHLSGRGHEVFTGYTIVDNTQGRTITRAIRSQVFFNHMTQEEIDWYISTHEPMDKAGAYAIQGIGAMFIEEIKGSFTNVMGLPVAEVYQDLREMGISITKKQGGLIRK
ncbi:MAG: Maf family protein [Thermodesulfobacteriota bacterium]|nr:Maf family protein [Thermodesulfobacteriota bacterium]